MSKKKICHTYNKDYHPDYRKLYPDEEISPRILQELHKSDRKMEYMEWELKHTRVRKNNAGEIISVTPAREDSLERIEESGQFPTTAPSPEDLFLAAEEDRELRRCLARLDEWDQALIRALFVDRLTEREYGKRIGLAQKNINKHKRRILQQLKKLMESKI